MALRAGIVPLNLPVWGSADMSMVPHRQCYLEPLEGGSSKLYKAVHLFIML